MNSDKFASQNANFHRNTNVAADPTVHRFVIPHAVTSMMSSSLFLDCWLKHSWRELSLLYGSDVPQNMFR